MINQAITARYVRSAGTAEQFISSIIIIVLVYFFRLREGVLVQGEKVRSSLKRRCRRSAVYRVIKKTDLCTHNDSGLLN